MIKNNSKNKTIIRKHKVADNVFSRGFGLMFSKKSSFDYGLVFDLGRETTAGAGLHMFFVFYKINVIFLDSKKRVVDIKEGFKPFTIYNTQKKCRYLIELPLEINTKYYSIKDKISWD